MHGQDNCPGYYSNSMAITIVVASATSKAKADYIYYSIILVYTKQLATLICQLFTSRAICILNSVKIS